jgi:secreted trypsin-like serine protease
MGSAPYREAVARFLRHEEPKIVGGKPAPEGSYPWQVSIGVSWIADPYRAHFCGGAVYSANWIVTAGHCLDGSAPQDIIVTAGTHTLGTGGSRHNVKRVVVKSDFNSDTWDNDIALMELMDPLPMGDLIRAIPPISTDDELARLKPGTPLTVVGWGATQQGGNVVRALRFVEVPFVERATCNRPLAYDGKVTSNMICAGVAAGGKDSCQGDSGGPLTVEVPSGPRLAGIVSWGEGCAQPNKVGVYTRVSRYGGWVAGCVTSPAACR